MRAKLSFIILLLLICFSTKAETVLLGKFNTKETVTMDTDNNRLYISVPGSDGAESCYIILNGIEAIKTFRQDLLGMYEQYKNIALEYVSTGGYSTKLNCKLSESNTAILAWKIGGVTHVGKVSNDQFSSSYRTIITKDNKYCLHYLKLIGGAIGKNPGEVCAFKLEFPGPGNMRGLINLLGSAIGEDAIDNLSSTNYVVNGIKLGEGIAIHGDWNNDGTETTLYWAPVNCGYEARGTAGAKDDHRMGKLYQWGAGDSSIPYKLNGVSFVASELYYDAEVPSPWFDYDAVKGTISDKWNNNQGPCPASWRLPTSQEFKVLCANRTVLDSGAEFFGASSDKVAGTGVFFPAAGQRESGDGSAWGRGEFGCYWSSTPSSTDSDCASYLSISTKWIDPQAQNVRAWGYSVRCVKE